MIEGFHLFPGALPHDAQATLVGEILRAERDAPFFQPVTPGGQAMSVRMTSLGERGWITDRAGYRYETTHPLTRRPWPAMPSSLLDLWTRLTGCPVPPDACLVNLYRDQARMGLHQDRDEADFSIPVLSISLGDTAVFRIGGTSRKDPTQSVRLSSGDACVLSGPARLAFHGVDRIIPASSRLLPGGGRFNLTVRRAAAVP